MIVIVMGVSGSGKTTVGKALAQRLGWHFYEGDDYHSQANIEKMRQGIALEEVDRLPWLAKLEDVVQGALARGENAVLTCSALKQRYQAQLRGTTGQVVLVHLVGSYELIVARLQQRLGHFMQATLLQSQFDTLEANDEVLQVDIRPELDAVVQEIVTRLQLRENGDQVMHTQVLLDGLMFPEAPRWHAQRLWFTDQHAQQIVTLDLQGERQTIATLDDLPGGLGWLPNGDLLVVSMTKRQILRLRGDGLQVYADLHQLASFHCNDMVVDATGRAYVGNFGYDLHGGQALRPAELIAVEADGKASVVAADLIFPNGCVISPAGDQLIVAETFAQRITAFAIDAAGALSERRVWAELGAANPDGICLDPQGALWVASPSTGEVMRVLAGGAVTQVVRPVGNPYACTLGGDDQKTLLITTSETDDPVQARHSRSGRIEYCRV